MKKIKLNAALIGLAAVVFSVSAAHFALASGATTQLPGIALSPKVINTCVGPTLSSDGAMVTYPNQIGFGVDYVTTNILTDVQQGLVWYVNGVFNGNNSIGTIVPIGVPGIAYYYTPTTPQTVTVKAVSTFNPAASDTVTINIAATCPPTPTGPQLAVSPRRFNFITTPGSNPSPSEIGISNVGIPTSTPDLSYSVVSSQPWLVIGKNPTYAWWNTGYSSDGTTAKNTLPPIHLLPDASPNQALTRDVISVEPMVSTFSAAGSPYYATLTVTSNDPNALSVSIPVAVTISAAGTSSGSGSTGTTGNGTTGGNGSTGTGNNSGSGTASNLPAASATNPPAITSVQGYNPSVSAATGISLGANYTPNVVIAGTYLIISGTFSASGNSVLIDGSPLASSLITFQGPRQIKVLLTGVGIGAHTVSVATSAGTTAAVPFTVVASTGTNIAGPVVPSLTLNGGVQGTYSVGQAWTLNLTGGEGKTSFSLCNSINAQKSCTPWDSTDASGNWTQSGNFATSTMGPAWSEWIQFPDGKQSNSVNFTVVAATPANVIKGIQGYNADATPDYTLGTADPGTYLILYGAFGDSGNIVSIDGTAVASSLVEYQSANQINVLLTGVASGSHTVTIATPNGGSGFGTFVVNGSPSAGTNGPLLAVNSGAFNVGQSWTLSLTGASTTMAFTLCGTLNGGAQSCTPNWGTTDANGTWSTSGTFDASSTGSWTEWMEFPNGATTNHVAFSVGLTPTIVNAGGFSIQTPLAQLEAQLIALMQQLAALLSSSGTTLNGEPTSKSVSDTLLSFSGASLPASSTKTVTSGGTSVPVTYAYLPDGEVRATFAYQGKQYAEQNYNSFGTGGGVAAVQANGSFGLPYTGSSVNFNLALINQIAINSPANGTVFPGFTFDTPLYYVDDANPYFVDTPAEAVGITQSPAANVPTPGLYDLVADANGNLIGATPVTISILNGAITTGTEIAIAQSAVPVVTRAAVLQKISFATSLSQAIGFAEEGGLTVVSWNGDGEDGATVTDPKTGTTLATITEWNDLAVPATSTISLNRGFLDHDAFVASTPVVGGNINGKGNFLSDFMPIAFAASAMTVGNDTGQNAYCSVVGTNGAAHLNVWANGQIYGGGISSYGFSGSSPLTGGQAMIADAQSFINGLGAGQLIADSAAVNQIRVQFQSQLGGPAGVAIAVSTENSDGSFGNTCTANLGQLDLVNSAEALNIEVGSPAWQQLITNVVTHEVLHCMGLGHSSNALDIMDGSDNSNFQSYVQWATSAPSIDPAEMNTLKQIADGQVVQVENCDASCAPDYGLKFTIGGGRAGAECVFQSTLCPDTAKLWNDQIQSCVSCQQLGYPKGWIADQDTGVCALAVSGGYAPKVPLQPSPTAQPICYCTSAGSVCLDNEGNEVSAPSGFSCPTPASTGEVCTCFNGSASCNDTNGNSAQIPSDFICKAPAGSPIVVNDYSCDIDNACTYVGNGTGDYPDATCNNSC